MRAEREETRLICARALSAADLWASYSSSSWREIWIVTNKAHMRGVWRGVGVGCWQETRCFASERRVFVCVEAGCVSSRCVSSDQRGGARERSRLLGMQSGCEFSSKISALFVGGRQLDDEMGGGGWRGSQHNGREVLRKECACELRLTGDDALAPPLPCFNTCDDTVNAPRSSLIGDSLSSTNGRIVPRTVRIRCGRRGHSF